MFKIICLVLSQILVFKERGSQILFLSLQTVGQMKGFLTLTFKSSHDSSSWYVVESSTNVGFAKSDHTSTMKLYIKPSLL